MSGWSHRRLGTRCLQASIVLGFAVVGPFLVQLHAQEIDKIKPLYFTRTYGGAAPLPQILTVTSGNSFVEFSASARTSSGGDWLSVSTQNSAPVSVMVNDSSKLEPGSYTGEVVLTGQGTSQVVEVHLIVTSAEIATFDRTPPQLSFSMNPRGSVSPQVMQISGLGPEPLPWRLVAVMPDESNFLTVSAQSGTGPTKISVSVAADKLPDGGATPGIYTTQLLFISARSSVTVPVRVTVADVDTKVLKYSPANKPGTLAKSLPLIAGTNLWPANTSNCFCGQFNNSDSQYGGLTTAPDGTQSAKLVVEANPGSGAVSHYQYYYTDLGAGQQTISFHFKADLDSWVYIISTVDGVVRRAFFNLGTGTAGSNSYPGSSTQIISLGNGWYRCAVTFTVTTDSVYNGFGLATGDQQFSYTARNGNGVYEWGQQAEHGATLSAYQANLAPCFGVSVAHDASSVTAGSSIGFTTGVLNQATPAIATTLNETLPTGAGFNWVISPAYGGPGTCSITGAIGNQALACDFSTLQPGAGTSVHVTSGTSSSTCGVFSATATGAASGTQVQASDSVTVQCAVGPFPPAFQALTTPGASGTSGLFTLQYSDADGNGDFYRVQVSVNDFLRGFRSCLVYYTANADVMYLLDDLGATWKGPIAFGSAGVLMNSQCALDMGRSTRVRSGNNLTLNLYFTFNPGFTGAKSVFTESMDSHALSPGWQTVGSYTVTAGVNSPPSLDLLTPGSGSGSSALFKFKLSDPDGGGDLDRLQVIFQNGFNPSNSCYVYYAALSGLVYLASDNPATFQGPVLLGQSVTLQNSQCLLRSGTSSVTYTGNAMEVSLDIAFKVPFAGAKTVYAETRDRSGVGADNWQTMGTWTAVGLVNVAPTVDTVNPASGSGTVKTFNIQYSDGNGYADLERVQVLFNSTLNFGTGCLLQYVRGSNLIYLQNDAGTGWVGPQLLGTAGTLQNSRCALNVGSATASGAGNSLQLALPMTFQTSTFGGLKNTYGEATDSGGLSSTWHALGTWTVQ